MSRQFLTVPRSQIGVMDVAKGWTLMFDIESRTISTG